MDAHGRAGAIAVEVAVNDVKAGLAFVEPHFKVRRSARAGGIVVAGAPFDIENSVRGGARGGSENAVIGAIRAQVFPECENGIIDSALREAGVGVGGAAAAKLEVAVGTQRDVAECLTVKGVAERQIDGGDAIVGMIAGIGDAGHNAGAGGLRDQIAGVTAGQLVIQSIGSPGVGQGQSQGDGLAACETGGGADFIRRGIGANAGGCQVCVTRGWLGDRDAGGGRGQCCGEVAGSQCPDVLDEQVDEITFVGVDQPIAVAAADRRTAGHQVGRGDDRPGQRIDQIGAGGRSPAGAEIIAGHRREFAGAAGREIIAGGDVMKTGRVPAALANRVQGGIQKSDRSLPIADGLLVDQGREAGP